jgi:hypothetical protein
MAGSTFQTAEEKKEPWNSHREAADSPRALQKLWELSLTSCDHGQAPQPCPPTKESGKSQAAVLSATNGVSFAYEEGKGCGEPPVVFATILFS